MTVSSGRERKSIPNGEGGCVCLTRALRAESGAAFAMLACGCADCIALCFVERFSEHASATEKSCAETVTLESQHSATAVSSIQVREWCDPRPKQFTGHCLRHLYNAGFPRLFTLRRNALPRTRICGADIFARPAFPCEAVSENSRCECTPPGFRLQKLVQLHRYGVGCMDTYIVSRSRQLQRKRGWGTRSSS